MNPVLRIIISLVFCALLIDVSYDVWGFGEWQSAFLGLIGYFFSSRIIKYTETR